MLDPMEALRLIAGGPDEEQTPEQFQPWAILTAKDALPPEDDTATEPVTV